MKLFCKNFNWKFNHSAIMPHAISIHIFFLKTKKKTFLRAIEFDVIVMKWNFYFHLLNERMSNFWIQSVLCVPVVSTLNFQYSSEYV